MHTSLWVSNDVLVLSRPTYKRHVFTLTFPTTTDNYMDTHEALALFSPTYLRIWYSFSSRDEFEEAGKRYMYRWHVLIGEVTELLVETWGNSDWCAKAHIPPKVCQGRSGGHPIKLMALITCWFSTPIQAWLLICMERCNLSSRNLDALSRR